MFLSRLLPPPQATGVCQDIMDVILPSMKVEDLAERIKVRQGLLGGFTCCCRHQPRLVSETS